jgi:hypothetical protein
VILTVQARILILPSAASTNNHTLPRRPDGSVICPAAGRPPVAGGPVSKLAAPKIFFPTDGLSYPSLRPNAQEAQGDILSGRSERGLTTGSLLLDAQ